MLNRAAWIVRPKEPFIEWARSIDDNGALPNPEGEQTVYLVPNIDNDRGFQHVLKQVRADIFYAGSVTQLRTLKTKGNPMKVSHRSRKQAISRSMVLFVAFLAGCASQLTQAPASLLPSEHLADKNYKIGEPKMVNVGEPLVKFQDYWTIKTEKPVATINKTVTLKGGLVDTFMEAGKQYPIVGQTRDGNRVFTLVQLHDALAMVNQDGSLHNHVAGIQPGGVMSGSVVTVVWELEISDPSARVSRGVDQQIDTAKGYENFEIIYTGVNSAGLNLTYREFSPDGLARVAFYQSLTYPADAGIVTFKNYKIEIHEANSESITYTVLQE